MADTVTGDFDETIWEEELMDLMVYRIGSLIGLGLRLITIYEANVYGLYAVWSLFDCICHWFDYGVYLILVDS